MTLLQSIPWHEQVIAWLYGGVVAVLTTISIFAIRDFYRRMTNLEIVRIDHDKLLLSLNLTLKHIDEKLSGLVDEFSKHKDREFERDKTNGN